MIVILLITFIKQEKKIKSSKEKESLLTLSILKEKLLYDSISGIFYWKYKIRQEAGTLNKNTGYISIQINKKIYLAHRLAFFYINEYWPLYVDHINGIRNDNKISNLRNVEFIENTQNAKVHRNGSILYIHWAKNVNKWSIQAYDTYGINKKKHLFFGLFENLEEAKIISNNIYELTKSKKSIYDYWYSLRRDTIKNIPKNIQLTKDGKYQVGFRRCNNYLYIGKYSSLEEAIFEKEKWIRENEKGAI